MAGRGNANRPSWGGPAQKPRRKLTRTNFMVGVGFVIFIIIVFTALGLAVKWYNSHSTDTTTVAGSGGTSRVVDITAGMTASQIGALLQQQGVITSTADFLDLITAHATENKLQPGRYTFPEGLKLVEIVDMLENGTGSARYKVTIAEGKAISQIKEQLDKDGKISGSEYVTLSKQLSQFEMPYLAGVQVAGATTMEGLLFPSTYFMS
jgi:cell division protein YceG involved in septum cleavage